MAHFTCINVDDAQKLLMEQKAIMIDIRDPQSFAKGHSHYALSLNAMHPEHFLQEIEYDTPILVICYHGLSSKNVAHYLCQQGFERVYSINGGFQAWELAYPENIIS